MDNPTSMLNVFPPSADLSDLVEMFWAVNASGQGVASHETFPGSGASLVFRFGPAGSRMVLLGPATQQATVEIDRAANYVGVRFRTAQLPRLADVSHEELIDSFVEIQEIGGIRVSELGRKFQTLDKGEQQDFFENVFRKNEPLVDDGRCRQAGGILDEGNGHVTVKGLAEDIGLHVRTLERIFARHIGLTPKQLARLVRLRTVAARLWQIDRPALAELALACGYADQAHMVRDFKGLTGVLPSSIAPGDLLEVKDNPRTRVVHRHKP